MNWRERYELLDPITEGAMTYHGRDSGSGVSVLIHLLEAPGRGESRALLHEVMSLPPAAYEHVRDVGEAGGVPYVITDEAFGAAPLPEWLRRARAGDGRFARASTWAQPVAPKETPAGDFTRVFGTAKAAPRESQVEAVPPVPPSPAPPEPPQAEPGEFTRLFSSPLAPEPARRPAVPAAGEITVLFRRPAADGAGELTKLLRTPAEPARPMEVAPAAPAREVGDFTRLLGAAAAEKSAPPGGSAAPPQQAPAAAPAVSEYTRVILPRPIVPAAPAIVKCPAGEPRRSNTLQVVIFTVLAVMAAALILFFVLWR